MAAIARIRKPFCSSISSNNPLPFHKSNLCRQTAAFRRATTVPKAPHRTFTSSTSRPEKRYTQAHEWIELSPDKKSATIGISAFASHALGDVVFVELPTTPMPVKAGDAIGAVESVKSASDIYSPVSGTIIEANGVLEEKPGALNKGAEGNGWIAKMEVEEGGGDEWDELMDEAAYEEFTKDG